jgi:hypothetical protein
MNQKSILTACIAAGALCFSVLSFAEDDGSTKVNQKKPAAMEEVYKIVLSNYDDAPDIDDADGNGDNNDSERAAAEKILKCYRENAVESIKDLEKMLKTDPDEVVASLESKIAELMDIGDDNPEGVKDAIEIEKIDGKIEDISDKISDLKEGNSEKNKSKIEALKKELKEQINTGFDLKMKLNKNELKSLQQEVEELQKFIKKREENKEKIIEKRLNEAAGNEDYMEW